MAAGECENVFNTCCCMVSPANVLYCMAFQLCIAITGFTERFGCVLKGASFACGCKAKMVWAVEIVRWMYCKLVM